MKKPMLFYSFHNMVFNLKQGQAKATATNMILLLLQKQMAEGEVDPSLVHLGAVGAGADLVRNADATLAGKTSG